MSDIGTDTSGGVDSCSPPEEINRHKLGSERFTIISRVVKGEIKASEGMKLLGLSKPYFYKLVASCRGAASYKRLVPSKRGRKRGSTDLDRSVERLIEQVFEECYTGPSASYKNVWSACQAEADARKIVRPSYYTVRRRIQAKDPRLLYEKKHGKEAANQRYGARPGHKKTERPLEWVQFDHTVVDLLLVDENDRRVIIGRPWISMAICLHTRVILGFYLSLLPPSAVSVAMLIENCVLPKDKMLQALGLEKKLWPVHGLMETIHTDNAKEFISDVLVLNCKDYGIDVKHRDVGKKHQGGHIESLIGTFMTTKVHFLPGTTGSNVIARKAYKSEARAAMTFRGLREFMIYQVCVYHETKHSGIGKTPIEAWNDYYSDGVEPKVVPESDMDGFRFRFYPELPAKQIVPEGIELFRRFYYAPSLKDHVRKKVLVKYDPYNLGNIRVKVGEEWLLIPCVRNTFNRDSHYELYRHQRQRKTAPSGTMTQLGGLAALKAKRVVKDEITATMKAKRVKKERGIAVHNAYSDILDGVTAKPSRGDDQTSVKGSSTKRPRTSDKDDVSNNFSMSDFMVTLRSQSNVDYGEDPILY